ncbi:MAG: transglutaminase-like domain-containing protein [Candidatus Omnitrophica bacterium]|nr:transglutaminase-like domain-containing protein [Candidatus Omnitrophota bacterium]
MKKHKFWLLGCAAILAIMVLLLNLEVTTLQGVDYKVRVIKLPLYLKLLDFFDRHYNYGVLVRKIVAGAKNDEDKAMKIFEWTRKNIKDNPKELPVIDDHVWHIIVRGYGTDDQFQDVFTTLCNYTNLNAFYYSAYPEKGNERKPLSFVKLGRGWAAFDVYNGVYFINKNGEAATVNDLSLGDWEAVGIEKKEIPGYYGRYFKKLDSINFKRWWLSRGAIQSPARRFIYSINKPAETETR